MTINDIIPYENNARIHGKEQILKLAENIKAFGFYPPIEVDENMVIISGHGRLEAAKILGFEKVKLTDRAEKGSDFIPVVIRKDLSSEEVKARRLADNRIAEKSTWDLQKVEIEIAEIKPELQSLTDFEVEDLQPNFEPIAEVEEPKKQKLQKVIAIVCPECQHEFEI